MDKPFEKVFEKSKVKKPLRCFEVSQDIYEELLSNRAEWRIKDVKSLSEISYGYEDKGFIKVYKDANNDKLCICAADVPNLTKKGHVLIPKDKLPFANYQVRITLSNRLPLGTFREVISGGQAKKIIDNIILKVYSQEEYERILKSHDVEYDKNLIQRHYLYSEYGKILHYENCCYYDINNAHGSGLIELFPKCIDVFMDMYEHRKDNDGRNKQIFNFYWGMLAHLEIHRGTYNWIVQRTTKMLDAFMDKVGGNVIYANTDGFISCDCTNPIESSDKIGEFKRKDGELYVYRGDNYWVLQFYCTDGTVETKSNIPLVLRDKIDLKNNKVVKYTMINEGHKRKYIDVKEVIL